MILYHGSNIAVKNPRIIEGDRKLDFGTGFYLTSSYEQARRWAYLTTKRRGTGKEIITVFEVDEKTLDGLNILKFETATIDWLKFVSKNRNDDSYNTDYEVVIGPVANDRTMPVIRRYFAGIYTEEEAIKRLLPQKLKDQYAFRTENSINLLELKEVIVCEK